MASYGSAFSQEGHDVLEAGRFLIVRLNCHLQANSNLDARIGALKFE
jgi:hypothetical protein